MAERVVGPRKQSPVRGLAWLQAEPAERNKPTFPHGLTGGSMLQHPWWRVAGSWLHARGVATALPAGC